jgi:(S)-ureidoglycine aminohydrolase
MLPEGSHRTTAARRFALVPPRSRFAQPLPGWEGCRVAFAASGALGAGFTAMQVEFPKGSKTAGEMWGLECFLLVLSGKLAVNDDEAGPGTLVYLPPGLRYAMRPGPKGASAVVIQKRYEPLAGHDAPAPIARHEAEVTPVPLADGVWARPFLPEHPGFDAAAEIVEVEPGMTLGDVAAPSGDSMVWMLCGEGLWRLDDTWLGATEGDALWIAPFCPRWFAALGRSPARFLRLREAHRQPL